MFDSSGTSKVARLRSNLSPKIKADSDIRILQSGINEATSDALTARAEAAGVSPSIAGFPNLILSPFVSGPSHPARAGAKCMLFSAGSDTNFLMSGRIGVALAGNIIANSSAAKKIGIRSLRIQ
jgi:hypothetical protein